MIISIEGDLEKFEGFICILEGIGRLQKNSTKLQQKFNSNSKVEK